MSTLTGTKIKDTYPGLMKTADNAALGATEKNIEDGLGNASTLSMGTTSASFTGTLDLSGATVTGLSEPGLVNGTGTDSLKQDDALTTNAANASGAQAVALGNGANVTGNQGIAIGNLSEATNIGAASVGEYASATGLYSSAWGRTSYARSDGSVAFGQQAGVPTGVPGGVAMGRQVVADLADTTHVRALKIVAPDGGTGGNGITMLSPNGTAGVITLTDSSELAVDGTPIGGGAAGLESGAAVDSMQSAASLTTTAASATGAASIVLGNGASDNGAQDCIILGNGANAQTNGDDWSVVIGKNAQSTVGNGIAIGQDAQSDGTNTIMIGSGAAGTFNTVGIGVSVSAQSNESIAIGYDADTQTGSNNSIAIGVYSEVTAGNTNAIAIGQTASARAAGAVALGKQVIAAKTDTVSVQALETQTPSTPTAGGIIMSDAGGTDRRLNITASGELQVDSAKIGPVVFSTGRVSETQATSSCDTIRTAVLIPANTFGAGDQLEMTSMQKLAGSNGTTYAEIWISTTGTVGSGPTGENIAQIHSSTDGVGIFNKKLYIDSANGTGNGTEFVESTVNNETGFFTSNQTAAFVIQGAIDWTVDQYLVTKVCIDNTGATWTNYGVSLRKIN